MQANKAFTKNLFKYLDYGNVFLVHLIIKLLEHNNLNNYIIKLVENKQSLYKLIYSLNLMKLRS